MSQENVEIVRSIYAQSLLDSAAGHEALAAMGVVEYVNPPDAIDPGVRRGSREVGMALNSLTHVFARREHRLRRLFDAGNTVVAEVVFHGRGASSGAEATQEEVHTWTFREGRLVRFEWGRDLGAALKAVGLEE
jgi:ketosteroid isomerase-like protein